MLGVAVGVQQADGDRLGLEPATSSASACGRFRLERRAARRRGPSARRGDAALGRHERRRVRGAQAVEVAARLAAELDDVGEALGGDERGARALALEQRVRRDGHAVREQAHVVGARAGRVERGADGVMTPSDWSSGVVGALAVSTRPPATSTASVNVPPTSTPSSMAGNVPGPPLRAPAGASVRLAGAVGAGLRRDHLRHGRELELLGLGQVLVRRAVAVVRQRHALARRALARRRPALQRVAVDVEAGPWQALEDLLGRGHIAVTTCQTRGQAPIGK